MKSDIKVFSNPNIFSSEVYVIVFYKSELISDVLTFKNFVAISWNLFPTYI